MAPKGPTPDKARMGLPDRWLHCPKTGTLVNSLFFPFKTPLCAMYDNQISERRLQFHPSEVFSSPLLQGRKIGLWIDLTNTDRYYFREEVTENDCIYRKMAMAGRGISPTAEETQKFIEIVKEFRSSNPDRVVGVHCTHGFNRTGFLIAAYLFQEEEWGLDAAIGEFQQNRHGGIYKQDYIDDLYDRLDPSEADRIVAPPKPDWEREFSFVGIASAHLNGNSVPNEQTNASVPGNGNSNGNGTPAAANGKQFMDGLVSGVTICEDEGKKIMLQSKIQSLCKYTKSGFPGLQPVSLSRKNINLLEQEPYMSSWKADGMRYIVYIHDGEVYAFDRDNEVFEIENLDFVLKEGLMMETLVDTEVIIDKVDINGVITHNPRMLIYDVMRFNNVNVMKEPFHVRFQIIQTEIIKHRTAAFLSQRLRREDQCMSVRRKDFFDLQSTYKLFADSFTRNISHEIDGLIFQPAMRPYETGRCDKVLKWKPPSHNSVDFQLRIQKMCAEGMLPEWKGLLFVQNQREPFGSMKATASLRKYDNKIIECTLEVDNMGRPKEWKFMRERTDKSLPNGLRTAQNVLETMTNPVTKEYLLDYIAHVGRVEERRKQQKQQHQHQHQHHGAPPEAKRQRV